MDAARHILSDADFEAAVAVGRQMGLEEAVALAFEVDEATRRQG